MGKIEGNCKRVVEASEWVSIGTAGASGPHLSATWGEYVRALSALEEDRIVLPVGGMGRTERNLGRDARIELLFATREVEGSHGPGQGCLVRGRGRIEASGEGFEAARVRFPWARALLVVSVEEASLQL